MWFTKTESFIDIVDIWFVKKVFEERFGDK